MKRQGVMTMKYLWLFGLLALAALAVVQKVNAEQYTVWSSSVVSVYQNGVKLTTGDYLIDRVVVMAPGSSDARFHLYDGAISSGTALRSYEGYITNTGWVIPLGIEISSGIYYSNIGTTVGTVQVFYKKRSGF